MNINIKICVVFSNFVNKIIDRTNLSKITLKNRKSTGLYHSLKSKRDQTLAIKVMRIKW